MYQAWPKCPREPEEVGWTVVGCDESGGDRKQLCSFPLSGQVGEAQQLFWEVQLGKPLCFLRLVQAGLWGLG
jgi:hypothetical protein